MSFKERRRAIFGLFVPVVAGLFILAACGGTDDAGDEAQGGADTATVEQGDAEREPVTLTILRIDGSPPNEAVERLAEEFQETNPHIALNFDNKSFSDITATVKLTMSGSNPPDIVQHNLGYALQGDLVRAGLLLPLDSYAEQGNWADRQPASILDMGRFTSDGSQWGTGDLFAVSFTVDYMGVWYNQDKLDELGISVPETLEEFERALEAAKAGGEIPIQLGAAEKYPAAWVWQHLINLYEDNDDLRRWIYGEAGQTAESSAWIEAAEVMQRWAENGYFPEDWAGKSNEDARQQFAGGAGVFMIDGSWIASALSDEMQGSVDFMPIPTLESGDPPVEIGSGGNPYSISSKSQNPDAAAAWIDFMMSEHAAEVLLEAGTIPASLELVSQSVVDRHAASGTPTAAILDTWRVVADGDGVIPWLDYSTPSGVDLYGTVSQQLIGRQIDPREATQRVQRDWDDFHGSRRD